MLLEMSNARQSKSQWADSNLHTDTSHQPLAMPHVHLPHGHVQLH